MGPTQSHPHPRRAAERGERVQEDPEEAKMVEEERLRKSKEGKERQTQEEQKRKIEFN